MHCDLMTSMVFGLKQFARRHMEEKAFASIYMYLMDEGVDVWRPVEAIRLAESIYQIKLESVVPESETWQFLPGDMVRCEQRELSSGKHLVAIEKVHEPF